jgi:signal transduction histidine kinase
MPNVNSLKTVLAITITNCFVVIYSVYFDFYKLHFEELTIQYFILKFSFSLLPVIYFLTFKNISLDRKVFHVAFLWCVCCSISIYYISINYVIGSLQVAIAYVSFFFLPRRQYSIFLITLTISSVLALYYSPSPYGFGAISDDLKTVYADDIISLMALTGACYYFHIYPRIIQLNNDLKFSNIGKASSFIIHEIQKPISRMHEKNIYDEDINSLQNTIDIAKRLQTGSLNSIQHDQVGYNDICNEIIEKYRAYIDFFNIVIDYKFDQIKVRVDSKSLSFILDNLIRNSIEANKDNVEGRRWIKITSTKNKIIIANPYSYPISKDDLFTPLKSSKPGNMGVGLHLCKTIADAQEHQLEVRLKDNFFNVHLTVKSGA